MRQQPLTFNAFAASAQANFESIRRTMTAMRQRLGALEADARLRAAQRTPRLPLAFRSQFGEDCALWELLGGQLDGFFIEAGAFDGVAFSVSYALEAVGWTGLLVEAIPERYEQCRAARPNSRVVHAALSRRGSTGTAMFNVVKDQYGGMLSYLKPTPQHAAATDPGVKREAVSVPLTSLDDLLKDHTGGIDVAVIDVEGNELDVLDGFDLLRHKPRVLLLEDNSLGKDGRIPAYMGALPYSHIGWVGFNRVYARADQSEIMQRAGGAGIT